jgi:hypothetical protein
VTAAAAGIAGAALWPGAAFPSTSPLAIPALPSLQVLGVLVALLPAWLAPAPQPSADGDGRDLPAAPPVHDRTEVPA